MKMYRTINQAIKELKKYDPGSQISTYWLRGAIKRNEIPHYLSGNRYLVDLDYLLNFELGNQQYTKNINLTNRTV